jgi:hypothetical protein
LNIFEHSQSHARGGATEFPEVETAHFRHTRHLTALPQLPQVQGILMGFQFERQPPMKIMNGVALDPDQVETIPFNHFFIPDF